MESLLELAESRWCRNEGREVPSSSCFRDLSPADATSVVKRECSRSVTKGVGGGERVALQVAVNAVVQMIRPDISAKLDVFCLA